MAAAMKGFCQDFSDQRRVKVDFSFHGLPDRYRRLFLFAFSEFYKKACRMR